MRNLVAISLIFISLYSYGQELNCKVTINADQVQTSDRSVFKAQLLPHTARLVVTAM